MASGEPGWFPGLAADLIDRFWAGHPELDPADYSTEAWIAQSLVPSSASSRSTHGVKLAPLPSAFSAGFTPLATGETETALVLVDQALNQLSAGDAMSAVQELIRLVHPVASHGVGYDLSHSDPAIPFSVLVSFPLGENEAALRLAESLLHEAMHLQLTLIESRAPMVTDEETLAYSPWQACMRPAQGLLHGLYVFRAIRDWLSRLSDADLTDPEALAYARRRQSEISQDLQQVSDLTASPSLTPLGRDLATWLLAIPAPTAAAR